MRIFNQPTTDTHLFYMRRFTTSYLQKHFTKWTTLINMGKACWQLTFLPMMSHASATFSMTWAVLWTRAFDSRICRTYRFYLFSHFLTIFRSSCPPLSLWGEPFLQVPIFSFLCDRCAAAGYAPPPSTRHLLGEPAIFRNRCHQERAASSEDESTYL